MDRAESPRQDDAVREELETASRALTDTVALVSLIESSISSGSIRGMLQLAVEVSKEGSQALVRADRLRAKSEPRERCVSLVALTWWKSTFSRTYHWLMNGERKLLMATQRLARVV